MRQALTHTLTLALTLTLTQTINLIYSTAAMFTFYTPTIVLIHSRGVITLLTIYKIPKLSYVFARCAIRL